MILALGTYLISVGENNPQKKKVKGGKIYFSFQFKIPVPIARMSKQEEVDTNNYIAVTIKKEKVVDASAELTFYIYTVQDPSLGSDAAHTEGRSSHLSSPSREVPSQARTVTN